MHLAFKYNEARYSYPLALAQISSMYLKLEQIKDKNYIVFDLNSGSFAVAIGLKNYNRYPKDENPTHENSMEAVSWEHGVYLPQYPSLIDLKLLKEKYGEEVKEEISEEKSFDIEIKEILSRVLQFHKEILLKYK